MLIEFIGTQTDIDAFPTPIPAAKAVPDWYKKMPRSVNPRTHEPMDEMSWIDPETLMFETGRTLKECIPVRDYITSGYVIPMWTDFLAKSENGVPNFAWPFKDTLKIEFHQAHQLSGCPLASQNNTRMGAAKMMSPWKFKTPPGYSCFFFSPKYSNPVIEILPGIVDTDTHHEVNFPFIYHGKDGENVTIYRGEPVVQIIPFKRQSWTSKIVAEEPDPDEQKSKKFRSFIQGAYRRLSHVKKSYK